MGPPDVFHLDINLGQVVITVAFAVVGWLIRHVLIDVLKRLSAVEGRLFELSGDVQRVIGRIQSIDWKTPPERRNNR
jgi:hypothetical protein